MTLRQRLVLGLAIGALWGASPLDAQIRSATGTVTDGAGAVLPGADRRFASRHPRRAAGMNTYNPRQVQVRAALRF